MVKAEPLTPIVILERNRLWRKANRAWRAAYMRAYRRALGPTYRAKNRAHKAVGRALANGTLKRPSKCSKCGRRGEIDAHHPDHSEPLVVQWLCALVCHPAADRERRRFSLPA
jgi:hypothetical protein